jgi:hypothetical protein
MSCRSDIGRRSQYLEAHPDEYEVVGTASFELDDLARRLKQICDVGFGRKPVTGAMPF